MSKNALRYPEAQSPAACSAPRVRGMSPTRRRDSRAPVPLDAATARLIGGAPVPAPTSLQRMQALGRLPAGRMNKTEAAELLAARARRRDPRIQVRVAEAAARGPPAGTPDFSIVLPDGGREIHE